jgi:outer membrane protein
MICTRRAFFALLMLVAVAVGARAETALSVADAVKLALEKNLSLGRDALDLAAQKRSSESSANLLYPSARVGAGYTRYNSASGAGAVYGNLSLSLSLSPTVGLKMRQLKLAYESGLISYEDARRGLELEVRNSFNSILLYQAKLNLALQNEEREKKNYDQVKAKYAAGLATELELLSAQVSFEEKGPAAESVRVSLEDALSSFRLLLGLAPDEALKLEGSLDSAASVGEKTVASALDAAKGSESLSVSALKKSLESARAAESIAAIGLASPTLTASGNFYPEASSLSSSGYADGGSVSLGVSLPLDGLLPSSSSRLSLAEAQNAVKKAESQLLSGQRESANIVSSCLRAIKSAAASIATLQKNVVLAQKKYDLTYEAYQKGVKDISDLEDAASSLDSAKVDVLSEEYTLLSKALALENELGLAFGTIGR